MGVVQNSMSEATSRSDSLLRGVPDRGSGVRETIDDVEKVAPNAVHGNQLVLSQQADATLFDRVAPALKSTLHNPSTYKFSRPSSLLPSPPLPLLPQ